MRVQTASTFAAALATVLMVPAAFGQRSTFRAPAQAPVPSGSQITPLILPMSNPVAPMSNPVAPMMGTPRTTPSVTVAPQGRRNDGNDNNNRRGGDQNQNQNRGRDRDVVYVPVAAPYYYPNYYPNYYPADLSATVPGQLPPSFSSPTPYVPYPYYQYEQVERKTSFNPDPNQPAPAPPTSSFVYQPQTEYVAEPRFVIETSPARPVVLPQAGTSRSDVIARLGQPYGQITIRGIETLYFSNGTQVVIGPDGRVTSAK
jgi:hypothetical protein